MQFLNRVKDFNQFCNSNWEVKMLKIMKCFKGSSAVWAEVHKTDWVNYQSFERTLGTNIGPKKKKKDCVVKLWGPVILVLTGTT